MRVPATETGQLVSPSALSTSGGMGNEYGTELAVMFPTAYRPILSRDPEGRLGAQAAPWAWETSATKKMALANASRESRVPPPHTAPEAVSGDESVVNTGAAPVDPNSAASETEVATAPTPSPEGTTPEATTPSGPEASVPQVALSPGPDGSAPKSPEGSTSAEDPSLPPLPVEGLEVSPAQVAPPAVESPTPEAEPAAESEPAPAPAPVPVPEF